MALYSVSEARVTEYRYIASSKVPNIAQLTSALWEQAPKTNTQYYVSNYKETETKGRDWSAGRPFSGVKATWLRGACIDDPPKYTVKVNIHCGGSNIERWEDNVKGSLYGKTGQTALQCQTTCNAHAECKAFVFRPGDGACFWKDGSLAPEGWVLREPRRGAGRRRPRASRLSRSSSTG
jgi:hypothetical protein